jgi:hypothetical protein
MCLPGVSSCNKLNTQHKPIGGKMKQLATDMLFAAIVATILGAAFWIMEWNYLVGWTYVWVLIGISISIGKRLDRK